MHRSIVVLFLFFVAYHLRSQEAIEPAMPNDTVSVDTLFKYTEYEVWFYNAGYDYDLENKYRTAILSFTDTSLLVKYINGSELTYLNQNYATIRRIMIKVLINNTLDIVEPHKHTYRYSFKTNEELNAFLDLYRKKRKVKIRRTI